jgi:hypothetical protein
MTMFCHACAFYWLCSLRDFCVRWSFGRCFIESTKVFRVVFLRPLVDCRIANLKVCLLFVKELGANNRYAAWIRQ